MDTKDPYDQSFFPPALKQQGFSATKFKRFFHENDFKRKPKLISVKDNDFWRTECHLFEPKECNFEAKAQKKKDSENIAMAKALMWLRDNQYLDHSFDACGITPQQFHEFYDNVNRPIGVKAIENGLKREMVSLCDDFNDQIRDRIIEISNNGQQNMLDCNLNDNLNDEAMDQTVETMDSDTNGGNNSKPSIFRNLFNNEPYQEPSNKDLVVREGLLKWFVRQRAKRESTDQCFAEMRRKMSELPIHRYKEQILKTIEENRVVVISGDTGCGKTTQIPQMIFEEAMADQRASLTNIVVTQPRRLSAISISERVAQEFGEGFVGNSIGYNVRFAKTLPTQANGAILFCSSGILLRKLATNPILKGVSHVVIDEVHERDVIIDFLLVLLKKTIEANPDIKLILMSASMNAHLFVEYFKCPLIEIPGRCYQVKHFYINDLANKIGISLSNNYNSKANPKLDVETVVDLVEFIHRNKADGAILVFLPGWPEIQSVMTALNKKKTSSNLMIVPVHSRLPHESQRLIFSKTPVGVRKVILSTNIAETSLTIDDVGYVIDSGLAKEMEYNSQYNVSNFGTHWISKANAKQRSGRAGRVKEGECYRLWTADIEHSMNAFPTPEMLRIPLENAVMQTKLYCPDEPIVKFLSAVPQPPPLSSIQRAINVLKDIKVLDKSEDLTLLGRTIVSYPTHPKLSVATVYSCFFSCLKPMLALVSHLSSNREPFQVMPDEKHLIRKVKNDFSYDFMSDHISAVSLVLEYQAVCEDSDSSVEAIVFREDNYIHRHSMQHIWETMKLFAANVEESALICPQSWSDVGSDVNSNWFRKHLLVSALVPALMPNLVRLQRGDIRNQKIRYDCVNPVDVNTGRRIKFVAESVFSGNLSAHSNVDSLYNSLVLYFKSFYSEDAKMITVCDASVVPPISLLLFENNKFSIDSDPQTVSDLNEDECLVTLRDNRFLRFRVKRDDLKVITQWSHILQLFFHWFLTKRELNASDIAENHRIFSFLQDFLVLTQQLLEDNSK